MRLLTLCLFALLTVTATAQPPNVSGSDTTSKLTTVLADLVQSVAQETGQTTSLRTSASAPFAVDKMPRSVQDAVESRRLRIDENNGVQVYILMSAVTDDTVRQLTDAGVTIEIRDAARRRVQARVPVARLQAVAQLAAVDAIRLPTYARRRTGNVNTEGDTILHADTVRAAFGLDGTGVRVGVVSDGLKGVFATGCTTQCLGVDGGPIATSDLPTATGVRNASGVLTSSSGGIIGRSFQANGDLEGLPPATPACAFAGAGAEGTALLEIVHDLAPGAKLSFANLDTDLAFNQAVNFLAASNDVVLDDIGFFGEPYDGTSAVSSNTAAALNNPAFPIRAYLTAVGNDADEHYFGAYANSGIDGTTIGGITNAGHLHLFQRTADTTDVLNLGPQPYNVIALPANGEVAIFLTWNDPFGASSNNYDLYLVQQSTGRVVASSTDVQNGRQDPSEVIDYVNRGSQDFFRIVVQNVRDAAQPRNLNIFSFSPECAAGGPLLLAAPRHERHNYNTATRSVSAQGDAGGSPVSVISVGAICSASANAAGNFFTTNPNASCLDTSNSTIEFFSSEGPTLDGRTKPDITGIDGVSISGAGSFGTTFFGTSAAAPHLGGIAALLLQSSPCLLNRTTSTIDPTVARTTVRSLLLNGATKLSSTSPDNVFGAGRADAVASVSPTRPAWKGSRTTITIDGNNTFGASLTPDQLGFVDPNHCALTALNWTGGCGTPPGSTITCGFGPQAISVTASNNGVTYSDPVDLQIVVTNFTVAVSPPAVTIAAGQTSSHVVTIAPQNGPYNTPVTLSCAAGNLPPQTTCAFDPPTVVPGSAGATSRLTVSTLASSFVPPTGAVPRGPFVWPAVRGVPWTPALAAWLAVVAGMYFGFRRAALRPPLAFAIRALAVACVFAAAYLGGAIALASTPMEAPGIAVFPATLTFGSQTINTTAPSQVVYVTNSGADALSITSITAGGDFSQVNNCGSTVAAGASCAIAVSFTPTVTGARTGSITIVDTASGTTHTVTLAGTGQSAPATTGGTPSGSYTLTINGANGTLSNFGTVTLTVQ
jgi:hypothetical protein